MISVLTGKQVHVNSMLIISAQVRVYSHCQVSNMNGGWERYTSYTLGCTQRLHLWKHSKLDSGIQLFSLFFLAQFLWNTFFSALHELNRSFLWERCSVIFVNIQLVYDAFMMSNQFRTLCQQYASLGLCSNGLLMTLLHSTSNI